MVGLSDSGYTEDERATGADTRELLSVGEVVTVLRRHDPQITESKLRYWEREGLFAAERTRGGHRLFCPETVERLRLILGLRSKKRLSLPTVRRILERMEEDPTYPVVVMEQAIDEQEFDPDFEPLPPKEAAAAAGLDTATLARLEEMGLAVPCPDTDAYDWEAVTLLREIRELLELGLDPGDLGPYANHARAVVEHEADLLDRIEAHNGEHNPLELYRRFRARARNLQRLLYVAYMRRTIGRRNHEGRSHP